MGWNDHAQSKYFGYPKALYYEPLNESYLRETLTKNCVHFSNPSNFNDPWDCCPMYSSAGLEETSCLNSWSRFFRPLTVTLPEMNKKAVEDGAHLGNPSFLANTIKTLNGHSREITVQKWRIYCLTSHPDSALMWAHYADKHRGICLEFDATIPCIGGAFQVIYQKNRPVIDCRSLSNFTEMAEKTVLTKSQDWAYEQEYRILARTSEFDQESTHSLLKTTGNFLELPVGALTGIIVGCKAEPGHMNTVRQVVHDCESSLNIYRAVQSDLMYRVVINKHTI